MRYLQYILLLILGSQWHPVLGQTTTKDTLLPEVNISGKNQKQNITGILPQQTISGDDLAKLNSLSVADAVKYFPGVNVKDYGGISGLKTVSVRSLGANYTAVLYDGLALPEGQGGQIDLGKFSISNLSGITLQNAQPSELLNTARAFASASVVSLQTTANSSTPYLSDSFNIGLQGGSFRYMNPNADITVKLADKWGFNATADYTNTEGDYPYTDYTNNLKLRRKNSDITSVRAEANLFYREASDNKFNLKTYYYYSDRGLPGAVIYDNFYAAERLKDENLFLQSSYQKKITATTQVLLNGRFWHSMNDYRDPHLTDNSLNYENRFLQNEFYLSAAIQQQISGRISAAYSGDYYYTNLFRKDSFAERQSFPAPSRDTWLNNLSLKFAAANLELQANLLHTYIRNHTRLGEAGTALNRLNPTVSIKWQPVAGLPLRLRMFYKNIFRAPTFNDLYYTTVGNTQLKPETANQYNIGATYALHVGNLLRELNVTADAYYNDVKNKIIAIPRQNLFQWSMQNLGIVQIRGIDIAVATVFEKIKRWEIKAALAYTYQHATDHTDPGKAAYGNQIPYTPEHSGSLRLSGSNGRFSASYNIQASSYRYTTGEQLSDGYLKGWGLHDINFRYALPLRSTRLLFSAELNNIFNAQYEIVKFYPMPGINYRLGAAVQF
ncbi:hypothetical protein A8C56_12015 [Niabella ginsenosidivorans]|uniref:TonB-dependent receptor n=1 Tax=Niabella ginsenosidivorans TaxID=1176587 RepID=A0A1A9I2P9_9BACT|nr:TonB-dependent receptor [Niabella ginsenosidivorans]ANH81605.1 hypothetical protein A8C56_12015 [Niabella ginsenosidivorans]